MLGNRKFKSAEYIGPFCKDRYVRVKRSMMVETMEGPGRTRVTLPQGAIGYCYAAPMVIHVGFTKTFDGEERAITRYDYHVTFGAEHIDSLEISEG